MPRYQGRLELTWTNKDLRLLAHEDGSYEWLHPSDYRVAEVRLLHDVGSVGDVGRERASQNLLIRGDALNALTSLGGLPEFSKRYVGKVKLAYLDPPFNTQESHLQYDDALEHSVWLTMIRDRLVQIRELLSADGSVWLHLNDDEVHRARLVLDEVFGPKAFVTTVIWQKRLSRESRPAFSSMHDYLLVYSPMGASWSEVRNRLLDQGGYSNPDNDPNGPWRSIPMSAQAGHATESQFYTVVTPTGVPHPPPKGRCWTYTKERLDELIAQGRVYWPRKGNGKPRLKKYPWEAEGLVPFTIWLADEVGDNNDAKKQILEAFPDQEAFDTPKPEGLMKRIIEIGTNPGDIVLDCFLGSGTTAAVAHKLGRRWVGIERDSAVFDSFALPRLTKVVQGKDPGGITTIEVPTGEDLPDGVAAGESKTASKVLRIMAEDGRFDEIGDLGDDTIKAMVKMLRDAEKVTIETLWDGGGGFNVLDVGLSMFQADGGIVYLSDLITNGQLAEVTAAQLGYSYQADPPFSGRKGRTRLAVVDGVVNDAVVQAIVSALSEEERVVLCGTAIDTESRLLLRELRPGSTMRKIPAALLDEYRDTRQLRRDLVEAQAAELVEVSS